MTIDSRVGQAYKGPPLYSGTRMNTRLIGSSFYVFDIQGLIFYGADLVPSFVADTLLLPVTVPEQLSWSEEVAEARQVEHDVQSVINPPPGEETLKTAERLWDKCVDLTAQMQRRLPDCYAVDAKITIPDGSGGTREITGGEYKVHLREIIPEMLNTVRSVTYIDPSYELEGDNVRIRARRADSSVLERTPISFLVGPGPDGQWRILEQNGEGLPESLAKSE
jgi:hypothetical protein